MFDKGKTHGCFLIFVIFIYCGYLLCIGFFALCVAFISSVGKRACRRQEGPIMSKRKAMRCDGEDEDREGERESEREEDRIVWPPCVIIENTRLCKTPDGRWTGLGNPEMACFLAGHP